MRIGTPFRLALAATSSLFLLAACTATGTSPSDSSGTAATAAASGASQVSQAAPAAVQAAVSAATIQVVHAPPAIKPGKKIVGVVLYPDFEVLDVYGPIEMWGYVPDFQVVTIAQTAGAVKSFQGVSAIADFSFETAPKVDILMVPGGLGTFKELENEALLAYIRKVDETSMLTTSVCTGSALLAKAGVLDGRKATTNKTYFNRMVPNGPKVLWQGHARWVEDGKYVTSSGVSAGTDMALAVAARFHGKAAATQLAKSLEYQWNDDPDNDPFAVAFGVSK
jgi:putative intracellular protease/amidase